MIDSRIMANSIGINSLNIIDNLTLRLNQLTKQLEDIDKDNSLTDKEKQQKKAEIQKQIEELNNQIDVKTSEEKSKKQKIETKKKVKRIKEEINKAGSAKLKKIKAQQYMMQGIGGTYTNAKQINDLTKIKEQAIKEDGIDSARVGIIDKMLKDVTNNYKNNVEISKKATKEYLNNNKKVNQEKNGRKNEHIESRLGDDEKTEENSAFESNNLILALDVKI